MWNKIMANKNPFENYAQEYDGWFEKNKFIYESELQAVKELLPRSENGVEVGVGSGRFAGPLIIKLGVDPSKELGKIAKERGIEIIGGVAESLPFHDSQFDFVLMVTTICFPGRYRNSTQRSLPSFKIWWISYNRIHRC